MKTRLFLLTLVGLAIASPQRSVRFAQNTNVGVPLPSLPTTSVQSSAPAPTRGNESPIAAVRASSDSEGKGLPLNQPSQGQSSSLGTQHFTVRRESAEDFASREVDEQPRFRSPFTRFLSDEDDFDDDVLSRERFDDDDDMIARISLGRRFHPQGVPISRAPAPSLANQPHQRSEQITNPHIHSPDLARLLFDDSFEIDDDDDDNIFVNLSPSVRAVNHDSSDERLSLTNSILNQYNFVDTQGTINWGYRTNDQFQEHKVKNDGTMQGEFGWTAPEGSEISIKYIADEGGYQVVSSTGTYQRESADVLAEREKHFQEHARARARLNPSSSLDAVGGPGAVGVPLPSVTTGAEEPSGRIDSPAGFVVIDDEDDFPLLAGGRDGGVPLPNIESTDVSGRGGQDSFGVPIPNLDLANLAREEGTDIGGVPLPPISSTNRADNTRQGQGFIGVPIPTFSNAQGSFQGDSGIPLPDFRGISPQSSGAQGSTNNLGVPLPDIAVNDQGSTGGVSLSAAARNNEGSARQSPRPTSFGVPLPDITSTFESESRGVPLSGISGTVGETPRGSFGVSLPSSPTSGITQTGGVSLSAVSGRSEGGIESTSAQGSFGVPLPGAAGSGVEQTRGVPLSGVSGRRHGAIEASQVQGSFGVALPNSPTSGISQGGGVLLSAVSGRNEQIPEQAGTFGVPLPGSPVRTESTQGGVAIPNLSGAELSTGSQASFGVPLSSAVDTGVKGQSRGSPIDQSFGVRLPGGINIEQSQTDTSPKIGVPLPMLKSGQKEESPASIGTSSLTRQSIGVALPPSTAELGVQRDDPATTGEQLPVIGSGDLGFDTLAVGVPIPTEGKTGRSETELPVLEQSVDSPATGSGVGLPSINIKDPSLGIIGESISIEPQSSLGVDLPSPSQPNIQDSQQDKPLRSSGVSLPKFPETKKESTLSDQAKVSTLGVSLPTFSKSDINTESESLPPAQTVHEKPDITIVKLPDTPSQGVSILNIPADQQPDSQSPLGVSLPERKQTSKIDTKQSGVSLPKQPIADAEISGFGVRLPKQEQISEKATKTAPVKNIDLGVPLRSGADIAVTGDSPLPKRPTAKTEFGVKLPQPETAEEPVLSNIGHSPPGLPSVRSTSHKSGTVKKVRTKITPISAPNVGVPLPDFPSEKMEAPSSIAFGESSSQRAHSSSSRTGVRLPSFSSQSNQEQLSVSSGRGVRLPNFPSERITAPTSRVIGSADSNNVPASADFGVSLPSFPVTDTKSASSQSDTSSFSAGVGVSLPSFNSEKTHSQKILSADQDSTSNLISAGKSLASSSQSVGVNLPISEQAQDQTAAASEVQSQILKGIFDELVKLSSSRKELPLP